MKRPHSCRRGVANRDWSRARPRCASIDPLQGAPCGLLDSPKIINTYSICYELTTAPRRDGRRLGAAGIEPARSRGWSVRLPAQEGRDVELVFLRGVMHRRLPPERIEPLVGRAPGIFGDRLRSARFRRPRGRTLRRHAAAAARATGRAAAGWPAACGLLSPLRGGRGRPRRAAAAGPSGAFPDARVPVASPRLARSSFWAGSGSSSIRGMRGARCPARSGGGGMKARGKAGSAAAGSLSAVREQRRLRLHRPDGHVLDAR